jgi:16S rRNA (guanine966-N2)-methyltransferase
MEAASRGAREVVMLDNLPQVVRQLEENKALLGLAQLRIVQADALIWLEQEPRSFDLVFVDPPFAADLLRPICARLETNGWLASEALIYLEDDAGRGFDRLPNRWRLVKEKQAGQVRYGLASR